MDRRIFGWIDRKQYFVFLLKIVMGSALYKTERIERNVLDHRMV